MAIRGRLFAWTGFCGLICLLIAGNLTQQLGSLFALLAALPFFAAAALLWALPKTRHLTLPLLPLILGLLLCALAARQQFVYLPAERLAGQTVTLSGYTASQPTRTGNYYRFTLKTDRVEADSPQRLTLTVYTVTPPRQGDRFTAAVTLQNPSVGWKANGLLSSKAAGVYLVGFDSSAAAEITDYDGRTLDKAVARLRTAVGQRIDGLFCARDAGLARALLLGDRSGLEDDETETIRQAGASHLLAVSGLHTTILVMGLFGLLRLIRLPRWLCCVAAALAAFGYMLLLDFSPSVTRAGIMILLTLLGWLSFRKAAPLNSLGLALTLMLFINPFAAFSVSLQMSALATFGILLATPNLGTLLGILSEKLPYWCFRLVRLFLSAFVMSIAATVFVLPVSLYAFSSVSCVSALSTPLLTPLLSLMIPFYLFSVVFYPVPLLAATFGTAAVWLNDAFRFLCRLIAGLPFALQPTGYKYFAYGLAIALLVLVCALCRKQPFRRLGPIALCAALVFTAGFAAQQYDGYGTLRAAVFSDANGSAVVLTHRRQCVVVGTGGSGYDAARILRYLDGLGITTVDALILPDDASGYTGGLDALTASEAVTIAQTLRNPSLGGRFLTLDAAESAQLTLSGGLRCQTVLHKNGFYIIIETRTQRALLFGGDPDLPDGPFALAVRLDSAAQALPNAAVTLAPAGSAFPESAELEADTLLTLRARRRIVWR